MEKPLKMYFLFQPPILLPFSFKLWRVDTVHIILVLSLPEEPPLEIKVTGCTSQLNSWPEVQVTVTHVAGSTLLTLRYLLVTCTNKFEGSPSYPECLFLNLFIREPPFREPGCHQTHRFRLSQLLLIFMEMHFKNNDVSWFKPFRTITDAWTKADSEVNFSQGEGKVEVRHKRGTPDNHLKNLQNLEQIGKSKKGEMGGLRNCTCTQLDKWSLFNREELPVKAKHLAAEALGRKKRLSMPKSKLQRLDYGW